MKDEDVINKILLGNTGSDPKACNEWSNRNGEDEADIRKMKNIWDVANPAFRPECIDSEKAERLFFSRISKRCKKRRIASFTSLIYRAAAVLFIPLLVSTIYLYIQVDKDEFGTVAKTAYQTITVPFWITSSVELTDGSIVRLNAGTTVRYPVRFDKKVREIELKQGEAFFEVNANPEYPFIVKAGDVNIVATGTRFNVNAYKNEANVCVSLDKGRISISGMNSSCSVEMAPGEVFSYSKVDSTYSITQGNVYNNYAWIDGLTVFRDVKLKDVFNKLEQKYNVHFVIVDEEIKDYPYHATFENESLSEILDILEEGNNIKCENIVKPNNEVKGKKEYRVSVIK